MNRLHGLLVTLVILAGIVGSSAHAADGAPGSGTLTCSPAPCVLAPVQATQGGFDAPIVANPANQQDLILGSDDLQCPYPTNSGFNLSSNGGTNWSLFCMESLLYNGNEYGGEGGPVLAYDLKGVAYTGNYYTNEDGQSGFGFQAFQKSSDGINWSQPAVAVVRQDFDPFYCWMVADTNNTSPYVNAIYFSCVLTGPLGNGSENQVVVSHSNNGGATWQQVDVAPIQHYPPEDFYTDMTVGKDGAVYLTWQYCNQGNACDSGPVYIVFSKSSDGGNTWSKPKRIATLNLTYPLPNTKSVFVPDGPVIAADASNGPYSGNLYVAMYNWTGTFMQLQVVRSSDGGDTWSKPVPVSPGITHDQFLPWISVSPTGLVGVSWLDRRNDPKNIGYQAYAGISSDGGLTFRNVQLTTAFSNPNKPSDQDIGDYTGNTWAGPNYFIAAWMDNSQSFENEDFVGGIRLH